ncbi:ligase-associated DNA damage response endonuclease PdeM [Aquabacterium sp. A7-Y]|uniref:ligase-associated DNA damage response endonuclease PdeM n=1 Tax=Aquabacterium sp. A7-Y TaxID=1349605 RepID=UPI00223E2B26|nr:ligase-associated DNA damage response endonuclease PdeM [Aquabacterium sp. A7-Y]MCW7537172.1 ligase-associated DNA damage response endonuclease PdeM [Aquabacterium sp. A7-Y]
MLTTDFGGASLVLLPEKAVFLPADHTLLIADAHIGKAVSFRRWGVPVPRGTTAETLGLLTALVERTGARRVVFLGDFLHSERSHAPGTLAALAAWRAAHRSLELVLVRGNHDERAGDPPAGLDMQCVDEPWRLGPLALCHHPQAVPGAWSLAGHLHPCIALSGRALDRLRLPCFWFSGATGVLPAFGSFTGMQHIRPQPGDRLFVSTGDRVFEVPRA